MFSLKLGYGIHFYLLASFLNRNSRSVYFYFIFTFLRWILLCISVWLEAQICDSPCHCLLGAGIAGVHGCSIISLPFLSISVVSKPLHSLNCVLSNNLELFLKYFSQNMYLKEKYCFDLVPDCCLFRGGTAE